MIIRDIIFAAPGFRYYNINLLRMTVIYKLRTCVNINFQDGALNIYKENQSYQYCFHRPYHPHYNNI